MICLAFCLLMLTPTIHSTVVSFGHFRRLTFFKIVTSQFLLHMEATYTIIITTTRPPSRLRQVYEHTGLTSILLKSMARRVQDGEDGKYPRIGTEYSAYEPNQQSAHEVHIFYFLREEKEPDFLVMSDDEDEMAVHAQHNINQLQLQEEGVGEDEESSDED